MEYRLFLTKEELNENKPYFKSKSIFEINEKIRMIEQKFDHKFFAIKKGKSILFKTPDEEISL